MPAAWARRTLAVSPDAEGNDKGGGTMAVIIGGTVSEQMNTATPHGELLFSIFGRSRSASRR